MEIKIDSEELWFLELVFKNHMAACRATLEEHPDSEVARWQFLKAHALDIQVRAERDRLKDQAAIEQWQSHQLALEI